MEWKELKTEMSAYENFDVRKNYIAFDSELKYNNIRRSNFKSDYQNAKFYRVVHGNALLSE